MKTLVARTRNSALLALAVVIAACSSESPTTPPPGGGGNNPPPTNSTITISVSNPEPFVSSTTTITANVTIGGSAAPNGTAVEFTTDFGVFEETGTNATLRTTTNGVATTVLTSSTAGTARITARVNNVARETSVKFKDRPVDPPPPDTALAITTVSPLTGAPQGGEIVTITGRNIREPVRVLFDNVEARVIFVSSTEIRVVSPAINLSATEQAREVTITVFGETGTPNEQRAEAPLKYRYELPVLTPAIYDVSPSSGPNEGNTRVTITGEGFQAPVKVFFGTASSGTGPLTGQVELQVLTVNFGQITALTPPALGLGTAFANNQVTMRVLNVASNKESTQDRAFRYGPSINITGFEPNEGSFGGGTRVTIFGWGFDDPVAVSIGGVAAQVVRVSGTEIVAITNEKDVNGCGTGASGTVTVTNIEDGKSATATGNYTYRVPTAIILSVSPNPVVEGSPVSVAVQGAGPGEARFTIGGVEIIPTSAVVVGDVTTYTMIVPTTLELDEVDCGFGGKKWVDTTFAITFTNKVTNCSDTLADGITVSPDDPDCRVGPDAAVVIDRANYAAAVGATQTGTLTVTNVGTEDLIITAITANDAEFLVTGVIPTTLAPGASQNFTVTYAPTDTVPDAAQITVTSNDPTPPAPITVQGNANQPDAAVTISKVDYVTSLGLTTTGTLTITNIGSGPLTISSITTSDNEFTVTGVIPTTIAAGASAAYTVTYAPTDTVADTAVITIVSNDPTPPAGITVTGSVNTPDAAVSITRTDYQACLGDDQDGTLTVQNVGAGPLTITAITSSDAEFLITGTIPTTLAANASTSFTVTYAPSDSDVDTATITIVSNDPTPPPTLTLKGTSEPAAAGVEISQSTFTACFGATPPGNTDEATLTITNLGCAPLTISSITSSDGEFNIDSNLPVTIPVGGGPETFTVTYTPVDSVQDNATITVTTNDPTPPPGISVTGQSGPQDLATSINDSTLSATIGGTATATLNVQNLGCQPLTITAITSSDSEFFIAAPLPVTINPGGAALNFTVTYSPVDEGTDFTTITVSSNDITPPAGILVEGVALVANASLSATPLAYVANTGSSQDGQFTVTNLGTSTLNVTDLLSSDPEFTFIGATLPDAIAAGASLTYTVRYTPADTTPDTAVLNISSNDPSPPAGISVTGSVPGPDAQFSMTGTVYSALVGATDDETFTVTNIGGSNLVITAITFTGGETEFAVNGGPALPIAVAPGASQAFTIRYTPTDAVADSTTVSALTNDATPPAGIAIQGSSGVAEASLSAAPTAYVAPTGGNQVGQFTVTNAGAAPLIITAVTSSDAEFTIGGFTGPDDTIAPGGQINYTLTYTPADTIADSANISILSNDATPPAAVVVTGTVPGPEAQLAMTNTIFSAEVGGPADTETFTITNTGGSALTVTAITFTVGETEFTITSGAALPTVINPGASSPFTVSYNPTDGVLDTPTINATTNDATPPAGIVLNGNAAATATWTIDDTNFDDGETNTITITNVGPVPLTVNGILEFSGDADGEYSNNGVFPFTLANPGDFATIDVTYVTTNGDASDPVVLRLDSTDPVEPADLSLTGNGP